MNNLALGPIGPRLGKFIPFLCIFCALPVALGAPEDGADFLLSEQNPDGSFGSVPLRDTGPALRALNMFGKADWDATVKAGGFLYYEETDALDLLARRARALESAEMDGGDAANALAGFVDSSGTWGTFEGWPGAIMETAQALTTFAETGDIDLGTVSLGLGFLTAQQGSDGGFAWEGNDTSEPLLTAEVLASLVAWRDTFSLSGPIEAAAAYLFGLQQQSGLLGTSQPELLTAMTLAATLEVDSVDTAAWSDAYAALAGAQLANGSWGDDVYTTAKAMLALGAVKPDLAIVSVSPAADPVIEEQDTTVAVMLTNEGRASLTQAVPVTVSFISGTTGEETVIGSQTVATLTPGGSREVSIPWATAGFSGGGYLKAVVDPDDTIGEKDRLDNTMLVPVTVLGGADVAVSGSDVTVQPSNPAPEETVTVYATVSSFSAVPYSSVSVTIHDGIPTADGTLLDTFSVSLDPGETAEVSWSGYLETGDHDIVVTVDGDGAIDEVDESNNQAVVTVTVAPKIDLQVNAGQVQASPTTVAEGDPIALTVLVYNGGKSAAGAFTVGAYLFDPETMTSPSDRELVATASVSGLDPSAATSVSLDIPTTGHLGELTLYGVADIGTVVDETEEGNNESSVTAYVLKAPNLAILEGDFVPPDPVQEGKTAQLTTTVRNLGGSTIYNVPVQFFLGSTSGTLIGSTTIQQVGAGSQVESPAVVWNTTGVSAGDQTLVAMVDPSNLLSESDESDNETSRTITVLPRPDLEFQGSMAASPAEPDQGDIVTLSATILNSTATPVSDPFNVAFYDGNPNSGGRLIGTDTLSSLGGNATAVASAGWDTEGWAGRHTLYAVIDPDRQVSEGDETDNQTTLQVSVSSGEASLEPVTNVGYSVAGDNVTLSWENTRDPAGYRIYRDGQIVNPPGYDYDLVPGGTVSASSSVSGHETGAAADGSFTTYWEGDAADESWTYTVDFGQVQEVAAFKVYWYSQGNMKITYAFQTWTNGEWYTRQSSSVTSTSTGVGSGAFTLYRTIETDKVRLFFTRSEADADPISVAEISVFSPGLVTDTTFVDMNVPAGSRHYEIKSASGTGREGEPAEIDVALGDIEPPTGVYAVAYPDRTEIFWTRSVSSNALGYEVLTDKDILISAAGMGGTMTATASSSASGHDPSLGVDSDTGTWWQSSGSGPWTYDITLPETARIYGLQFVFSSLYYPTDYDILGWTGTEWIVEQQVRDNGYMSRFDTYSQFGATNKIRLNILASNSSSVAISYVGVYKALPLDTTGITHEERPEYSASYRVAAMSEAHVAFAAEEASVPPAGQEPPLPPDSVEVSDYTRSDIVLSWTPVANDILAGYNVYDTSSWERLNASLLTETTFTDLGVIDPDITSYPYAVSSVNIYGYESPIMRSYTWTPPRTVAPALSQATEATTVTLTWTDADEPLRDGFNVYKDYGLYAQTTAPAFTDLDVSAGQHVYQVAGFDMFGREGSRSATVSATVVRTDLMVAESDLSMAPASATILDTGILTAVVHNLGDMASGLSDVAFYDGDPDAGGVLIEKVSLSSIAGYGTRQVTVEWILADAEGSHDIYTVVDPDDDVTEMYEDNNVATLPVDILPRPVYLLTPGDVDTADFPLLALPLHADDGFGVPVEGLAVRFVTVLETSGQGSDVTLTPGSNPGDYLLGWTSPDHARDGSTRTVTVTIDNPPSAGSTSTTYVAPANPLYDLEVSALAADPTAPRSGNGFDLVATVANHGSSRQDNLAIRFYEGSGGDLVLGEGIVSALEAGASATSRFTVTAKAGTTTYLAVADPDGILDETDEGNNQAALTLVVPENPTDLTVPADSITFSPASPYSGDQVTISATVVNDGLEASSVLVQAYQGDPLAGGTPLGSGTTLDTITSGSPRQVSFAWNTERLQGTYDIYVWVDPRNRISEANEGNNTAVVQATVAGYPTTLELSMDAASYPPNTDMTITGTVDPHGTTFSGQLDLFLVDKDGTNLSGVATLPISAISSATTYSATVGSSTYRAGDYGILGVLRDTTAERTRDTAPFAIEPAASLLASVRSNAPAYDPFATVEIDGTVTNDSINTMLPGVTATLDLIGTDGQTLEQASFGPADLDLEQEMPVSAAWALQDNPPGTYTVRLTAASGDVSRTAATTFDLRSTGETGIGIVADLAVDPDSAVPGTAATAEYQIDNHGNSEISGVPAQIILVSDDDGQTYDTRTFAVTLGKGGTVVDTTGLDTSVPEGGYSVLLQLEFGGEYRTFAHDRITLSSLTGELGVSPDTVEGGEGDVTIEHTITNLSSTALEALRLRVEVVSMESGLAVAEFPWVTDLPGDGSASGTETLSSSDLTIGQFEVRLVLDPDGGTPTELATASFLVVDTRAPVTTLSFSGMTVSSDGVTYLPDTTYVVLEAADNFSGVAAIRYSLDSGRQWTYAQPFTLAVEGLHTLSYGAVDLAGNEEASRSIDLVLDTSPPSIEVSGVEDGDCGVDPLDPVVSVMDASPTTISMTLNGEAYAGESITDPGTYTFSVRAEDLLGRSSEVELAFTIVEDVCDCPSEPGCGTPLDSDLDGDGVTVSAGDCDDNDPAVYPGAEEL